MTCLKLHGLYGLIALLTPTSSWARQEPLASPTSPDSRDSAVSPGSRIRLAVPGYGQGLFTATIIAVSAEMLRIRTHPRVPVATIPIDSVLRLQIVIGQRTQTMRWALRGAAVAMAIGAFLGAATGDIYEPACPELEPTCAINNGFQHGLGQMGRGALIGGLAGGVVGGVIGSLSHQSRWIDVPPSSLLLRTASAAGRRWQVTFAVRF